MYSEILETVALRAKIPTMMVGAPAKAKTAIVRQLAEDNGYRLKSLAASRMDPSEINGLPQGKQVGKTTSGKPLYATVYMPQMWQIEVLQQKKVVLFFDEFSNAPPAVRASLLTFFQDREFPNGQKLPEETVIIGAMNPTEEAADGYELDLPTSNRFFFIAWDPPAKEWYEGMRKGFGKKISKKELEWKRKIVDFIKDNPSLLHKQPTGKEGSSFTRDPSKLQVARSTWPSRRSWDNVSIALAHEHTRDPIKEDEIIRGLVGEESANGFRRWLAKNDSISPSDVIENPNAVEWEKLSLDDLNMVLRESVSVLETQLDKATALKVIRLFEVVADNNRASAAAPYHTSLLKIVGKIKNDEVMKAAVAMNEHYKQHRGKK